MGDTRDPRKHPRPGDVVETLQWVILVLKAFTARTLVKGPAVRPRVHVQVAVTPMVKDAYPIIWYSLANWRRLTKNAEVIHHAAD